MSPSHTILCIDDEALGLQIRKTVLERAGYRVLTAIDCNSGLSLFECEAVDAVVLDYSLPEMDGSQIASIMRRVKPKVPIMLLSAYLSLPESVSQFVDLVITKGEGPQALLSKVAELLRMSPVSEGGSA